MEDKPENAPEHCPGTQSDTAGKSSACAGCPNQNICASGEAKLPDPAIEEIKQSMKNVKNKIVVLSGKGGVGKSTFTSQLALALALNNGELKDDEEEEEDEEDITQVGVLDIDLCGPSIPKMFGLEGQQLRQTNLGWSPSYYRDNLGVISIGFMLPNLDDPVIWRGPKKNGLIKQFLRDVYWGDTLDYLVIDTPPGTSDEHLTIVQYLRDAGLTGAVIVTTPQDVACDDVRKEISFCKKVKIPILGIVENMSGFVCPGCKNESVIFPSKGGGGERLAKEFQIPFLGKIPLDPSVMSACENGKSILKTNSQSPASVSLKNIVDRL